MTPLPIIATVWMILGVQNGDPKGFLPAFKTQEVCDKVADNQNEIAESQDAKIKFVCIPVDVLDLEKVDKKQPPKKQKRQE
jgi:hypothetical protein